MKKFLLILIITLTIQSLAFSEDFTTCNLNTFTNDNKYYGLKNSSGNIVVKDTYKKLIRLGNNAWIIQNKKNKFGIIDCYGNILIQPKYTHAERYFNTFVKLGNLKDFGLYDDKGKAVIPAEYRAIMPLFGKKFLTYKNYKYGIYDEKGEMLLDNVCEYIYMPNPKKICLKYENQIIEFDDDIDNVQIKILRNEIETNEYRPTKDIPLYIKTSAGTGYSIISATDYTIKAVSSISNAYEKTIDELMFSQGIDTVSIFLKMSWLPKFPVIFAKNYWDIIANPASGPLSDLKTDLKEQMK